MCVFVGWFGMKVILKIKVNGDEELKEVVFKIIIIRVFVEGDEKVVNG